MEVAADRGWVNVVEVLLDALSDDERKDGLHAAAVATAHYDGWAVVRLCPERGFPVNETNASDQGSIVEQAVSRGNLDFLECLVRQWNAVVAKETKNGTILSIVCEKRHIAMV